jgi:hypothetical protein
MDKYDKEGKLFPRILYGNPGNGTNSRSLDITYIPCVPKQLTPYNKHKVDKECIADLKDPKALNKKFLESKTYIGRP